MGRLASPDALHIVLIDDEGFGAASAFGGSCNTEKPSATCIVAAIVAVPLALVSGFAFGVLVRGLG